MQIGGLHKLSLIDYPGKIACTIFLFGCNFKCGFCHNPELVLPKKPRISYSEKEILSFLKERKKYLGGVCITGGEPLIHRDIWKFLGKIKKLGYNIKIDTNGSNPELLKELIDKKMVDYVALDVKANKESYAVIAGTEVNLKGIEKTIKLLAKSKIDYELRTTVIRGYHDKEKLKKIAKWLTKVIKKPKKYTIQNFIPRKDKLISKKFEKLQQFNDEELKEMGKAIEKYYQEVRIKA
jgi:pyruvate formate lyase activating enzyme